MKKKLLILSIFTVLICAMTGCTKTLPDDFAKDYDYYVEEATALTDLAIQTTLNEKMFNIASKDVTMVLNVDPDAVNIDAFQNLFSGTATAMEESGQPGTSVESITYDIEGDNVTIICVVPYEKHNVNYEYTFVPDERAEYAPDLVPDYQLIQVVVSTDYPMSELLKMAGMNTLMGMGVVFLALIFIAFIISLFKFLPGSGVKQQKAKEEAKKAAQAGGKSPAVSAGQIVSDKMAGSEDLMNDEELVAVITAAIYAANAGRPTVVSSDRLVVRSIKRAAR